MKRKCEKQTDYDIIRVIVSVIIRIYVCICVRAHERVYACQSVCLLSKHRITITGGLKMNVIQFLHSRAYQLLSSKKEKQGNNTNKRDIQTQTIKNKNNRKKEAAAAKYFQHWKG